MYGHKSNPAVDAVMIGRAAYDNPWQFVDADRLFGTITTYRRAMKWREDVDVH